VQLPVFHKLAIPEGWASSRQAVPGELNAYEGAFYHVFSRGCYQQDIFATDDDRHLFLDKYTDWEIVGFNPLSRESEGGDHQKENGAGTKF
jgi:hypothetical protein